MMEMAMEMQSPAKSKWVITDARRDSSGLFY